MASNSTNSLPHQIMGRWNVVQHELIPELGARYGELTPKLEKLIHVLDWVRVQEFVDSS